MGKVFDLTVVLAGVVVTGLLLAVFTGPLLAAGMIGVAAVSLLIVMQLAADIVAVGALRQTVGLPGE